MDHGLGGLQPQRRKCLVFRPSKNDTQVMKIDQDDHDFTN